ncbi:S9 family peptidase [Undibacterium cyanobacteriorum]|uniref:S9 family peptidase n=1 Tax=Undibacterium cyanobacteriorum TaxID=3073561 RepID=A0ABY9RJK7_9BURK|nr:S9 family peptidase [Undibacterium sp. 20NA77.5]WMW81121.1 S9 family peptidase [Undibacterium sp. 20NA77.5]
MLCRIVLGGLILISSVLPLAHAQDKTQVPVEAFVEREQFSMPRLSPDGKHIAVNVRILRGEREVPTLTVYSLPELTVMSRLILPGFEVPINFFWASNSRLVIRKGIEVGDREPPQATGEIIAADLDGTKVEYLFGYKNISSARKGERYGNDYALGLISHIPESYNGTVLVSTHEWRRPRTNLLEINTLNGARHSVADIGMPDLDFLHQADGLARFAFGHDDKNELALFRFYEQEKEWKRVDNNKLGYEYEPLSFTADSQFFYLKHSIQGEPNKLYREHLASGERVLLGGDANGDISLLEYSSWPREPFAFTTAVGALKATYINKNSRDAKLHQTLSASFPDAYVHFINFSDDGKKLLFYVFSDRDPGAYYLFDRDTGKADLLFANLKGIDPDRMAVRKPIELKARDGFTLTGYLTAPANPSHKPLPLVLLPHGGPFGVQDTWSFDSDAQFLASRGYAVLQVNFRGSNGRGVAFRDAGMRQFGGKMIDDLIDGVKWASTQAEIDGKRVCVFGASYGGYAAMMVPVKAPNLVKCAIGYAGLYDLAGRYDQEGIKGETRMLNWLNIFMGSDLQKLVAESPINLADKVKVPVFLVHGNKDKRTELAQAEVMREALRKAGNEPQWMMVKNEGHGFYDSEHRKEFYLKLDAFLKKHIGD